MLRGVFKMGSESRIACRFQLLQFPFLRPPFNSRDINTQYLRRLQAIKISNFGFHLFIMMRLKVATAVSQNYRDVFRGFNRELFVKLNPPFPPVKVLRFEGMAVNDEVHLLLNFLVAKEKWISVVTAAGEEKDEIYFVDEGIQLPFIFKSWRHRHRILRRRRGTLIVDEIIYQCRWEILSYILYPFLYLQFLYRKAVYKFFFNKA